MHKHGDIVFFKKRGIIGYLVDFFSRSKCEIVHVAIYLDEDKTIETNLNKRVDYATLSQYKSERFIKSCKDITDEQRDMIVEYCESHIGEPYDLIQILEMFLKFFKIDLRYRQKNRKICSTLVWKAYEYAGIKLTESEDCSPDDLFHSDKLELNTDGHIC